MGFSLATLVTDWSWMNEWMNERMNEYDLLGVLGNKDNTRNNGRWTSRGENIFYNNLAILGTFQGKILICKKTLKNFKKNDI